MSASATRRKSPSATPFADGAVIFVLREDIFTERNPYYDATQEIFLSGRCGRGARVQSALHPLLRLCARLDERCLCDLIHGLKHPATARRGAIVSVLQPASATLSSPRSTWAGETAHCSNRVTAESRQRRPFLQRMAANKVTAVHRAGDFQASPPSHSRKRVALSLISI